MAGTACDRHPSQRRQPGPSCTKRLPAGPSPLLSDLARTSRRHLLNEEQECRFSTPVVAKMRARRTDDEAGRRPTRPSIGRVSIEIMYPKPCSNKRSDDWCATTISSSGAARDPVADGVLEPAFLGAVPNGVISGSLTCPPCFDPSLSPSLVSRSSAARKSLHVSSTATPARPCWSSSSGRA
jgi:hypothetical protein